MSHETPQTPRAAFLATRTEPGAGAASYPPVPPRRRGRPLEMSRDQVLQRIRELAGRDGGLFRIHRVHSGLYARARRLFGSWSAAVAEAGVDYRTLLGAARRRAVQTRRQNARRQALQRG